MHRGLKYLTEIGVVPPEFLPVNDLKHIIILKKQ